MGRMKIYKRIVVFICVTVFSFSITFAQEETPPAPPTMPDVLGLTVPSAIAQLNQVSLDVNIDQTYTWTHADPFVPYTISGQNPESGTEVIDGQVAMLTIARPITARLLYDDNDLTLINLSDDEINLNNIVFTALDGTIPASLSASEWLVDVVSPQRCIQIWSVGGRQGAKDVEGCQPARDIPWLFRGDASNHFWIDDNGATLFDVIQDGVWRGTCTIMANTSDVQICDLFIMPTGLNRVADDVTEYVYFRYTSDQLWVINRSEDRWMPTSQVEIVDGVKLDDEFLYFEQSTFADIGLLAPNQCLLLTTSRDIPTVTSESCDLIGVAQVDDETLFWNNGFDVSSDIMNQNMTCLSPLSGDEETVCLVPR